MNQGHTIAAELMASGENYNQLRKIFLTYVLKNYRGDIDSKKNMDT